jgi:hypothetical protein
MENTAIFNDSEGNDDIGQRLGRFMHKTIPREV